MDGENRFVANGVEQMAAASNGKIVTAGIASTTTVLIDQTSPLPLPTSSQ